MNIKDTIIAVLVGGLIVAGGFLMTKPGEQAIQSLGAVSSPEVLTYLRVYGPFSQGGEVLASSTTATAGTLTASELQRYSVFEYVANTGNTTLTLPATSTIDNIITRPGESRTWWIHNATTTAATTLTIAAGTGMDLIGYTTNDDVIDGTEYAQLTCYRQIDTDLTCETTEVLHVD
jgi:hypothetical protein